MSLRRLLATTNSRDHLAPRSSAPESPPTQLRPAQHHRRELGVAACPDAKDGHIHPKRWRKAHFTRFAPQPHARTRRKPPRREHPSLVPLRPPRGGATERDLRLSSARGSEAEQLWWGRSIYKGAHAAFIQNSRSARRDHFLMTLAVGPNAPPPTSKVSQPDATAVGLNAPLPAPKVRQPDATAVGLNAPPQPPRSASSATPVRPQRLLLSSGLRLGVGFRLNELNVSPCLDLLDHGQGLNAEAALRRPRSLSTKRQGGYLRIIGCRECPPAEATNRLQRTVIRVRSGAPRVRLASAGPSGARTQGGRIVGTIRPTEDAAPRSVSAAARRARGVLDRTLKPLAILRARVFAVLLDVRREIADRLDFVLGQQSRRQRGNVKPASAWRSAGSVVEVEPVDVDDRPHGPGNLNYSFRRAPTPRACAEAEPHTPNPPLRGCVAKQIKDAASVACSARERARTQSCAAPHTLSALAATSRCRQGLVPASGRHGASSLEDRPTHARAPRSRRSRPPAPPARRPTSPAAPSRRSDPSASARSRGSRRRCPAAPHRVHGIPTGSPSRNCPPPRPALRRHVGSARERP